jgi:predicted acetyltransferase
VTDIRVAHDVREFLRPISVGFGSGAFDEEGAERFEQLMARDRMLSAYDDGSIVGSAGSFGFELTVPGGFVPAAGVTVVAVLPTHRRRGILTELMRAQLADLARRGEPVACLWASEERIYGRFGYGLASLGLRIDAPTARAGFRDDPGATGRVRVLDDDEALATLPPIYERARAGSPGFFSRSESWWRLRRLRRPFWTQRDLFRAVWNDDAYALYTVELAFDSGPSATVEVAECVATSLESTREIWRYLFSIDLVERVKAARLPLDHELLLLLEELRRLDLRAGDNLWLRLVDVGAALEARARGDASVVLEVADAFLPGNAGRWRVGGDGVGRTADAADLALDVADLGSAYLGGFSFSELARAGRVRVLVPGAIERADDVFRWPQKPWCPEIF